MAPREPGATEDVPLELPAPTRTGSIRVRRPELGWEATVRMLSEISCDRHDLIASNEVICTEGEEVLFRRTREKRTPRMAS